MIGLLTDADIRNDPTYYAVIERNRDLIRAMGWSDESLVEQYNLAVSCDAQ